MSKHKKQKSALTGGYAVGEAIYQINPDVMAVYPITPQTPIIEYFAKKVADGEADTEIIPVESEHSAMSACIGSCASGARTMTASSSQGIMYMMEVLPVAASMRLPIVMAVANRAISGPINIHGDHSDAMAMREHGWIQLFSENAQEAYDNTFIAQKLAEKALLPCTVNLDGFILSHSVENLELAETPLVKEFLGEYKPENHLFNFENPKTFGPVALPDSYFEFRKQIYDAMKEAEKHFEETAKEFNEKFGRKYGSIEKYKTKDAETVVVAMGSVCGTIKDTVDKLREEGIKAGLLKIRLFRPFPYREVKKALEKTKRVIVMDRNLAFGSKQFLAGEIEHALERKPESVVYGLGGRDVYGKEIEELFMKSGNNREVEFLM
ncbi:MAG: transketolase C-terminal domain-containing protein [Candidatus Moranbacteria bacterium]|nr:transketolase C-terminal domain-containing protein [Candidatus Moranbacteria bacterium]